MSRTHGSQWLCPASLRLVFIWCGGRQPGWDVTARLRDSRTTELGLRSITAFSRRVRTGPGIVIGFSALDETDMETLAAWLALS
ncbi:hypothetical protein [Bordetella trematum]|uniref:hypothetical protein n=1 Tax=Bordetella trematum TaxID=123899 RepID=UPI003AF3D832